MVLYKLSSMYLSWSSMEWSALATKTPHGLDRARDAVVMEWPVVLIPGSAPAIQPSPWGVHSVFESQLRWHAGQRNPPHVYGFGLGNREQGRVRRGLRWASSAPTGSVSRRESRDGEDSRPFRTWRSRAASARLQWSLKKLTSNFLWFTIRHI
jgi:hypothetical protein